MKIRLLLIILILTLIACTPATGTLIFHANGEDFVRQGFTSKDGWELTFDHLYLTLTAVTAYQTDPPFDATSGQMPQGDSIIAPTTQTIDLASGDTDAPPITVTSIEAPVGHYNAISWEMAPNDNEHTLQLIGTATKGDSTIAFDIQINQTYHYACGEYVGSARNGFVDPDSIGTIEMTFHFDHLFGTADVDLNQPLNQGALGFAPLAALATNNTLTLTNADLEEGLTATEYATLLDNLATLGHVGEGHCYETTHEIYLQ